uniref:Late embryogenesis abundant protein 5 n=1 Tax=Rhizophora mucronata TaxID=61149 RepID=A0A2P2L721_RHIMU
MARSLSSAKVLSAMITKAINGRGFAAAASQGVAKGGATAARSGAMMKKTAEEIVRPAEKVSWVPDPRTGCYRPENVAPEIDAAELRAALLKKK